MWTQFWDMHSGGGLKEPPYDHIYIEAPEGYSLSSWGSRRPYESLPSWLKRDGLEVEGKGPFKLIYVKDILPEERTGDVPEQGYVWKD